MAYALNSSSVRCMDINARRKVIIVDNKALINCDSAKFRYWMVKLLVAFDRLLLLQSYDVINSQSFLIIYISVLQL